MLVFGTYAVFYPYCPKFGVYFSATLFFYTFFFPWKDFFDAHTRLKSLNYIRPHKKCFFTQTDNIFPQK